MGSQCGVSDPWVQALASGTLGALPRIMKTERQRQEQAARDQGEVCTHVFRHGPDRALWECVALTEKLARKVLKAEHPAHQFPMYPEEDTK